MTDRTAVYATRSYGGVGGGRRESFSYPDHECVRYIALSCRRYCLLHNLFGSPPVVSGSSIRLSGRLPKYFCNVLDMFGDRFARIGNGQKPGLQRKQMTRQLIAPTIVNDASFLRFQQSSFDRRPVGMWIVNNRLQVPHAV